MGLTSRAGVTPLSNFADIAGPMARTVADAATIFNVVVGEDPADPVTAGANSRREKDYRAFLTPGGLKGARIGVLREAYVRPTTDSEVVAVFERALADMKKAGAEIVDPAGLPPQPAGGGRGGGGCARFKWDLNRYFTARGENAPVKTVDDIVRSVAPTSANLVDAQQDTSPRRKTTWLHWGGAANAFSHRSTR
jgi:Asp-tRNA(Asn)/Glu-tRNA(Gln) amidotransferase A subunit family amidase